MKTLLFLIFLSLSSVGLAHYSKVEILTYLASNPPSLVKHVAMTQGFLPTSNGTTVHFILDQPGFVFERPLDSMHECDEQGCKIYERKTFSVYGSFRRDLIQNKNHFIAINWAEVVVTSLRVWTSNTNGEKLDLVSDRLEVTGVYL